MIDPYVQLLSFWDGDKPLASLTYYATHPQSYYGKGGVSCDFPGLARGLREQAPARRGPHPLQRRRRQRHGRQVQRRRRIANRMVLAERLAQGMKEAFDSAKKVPVDGRATSTWRVTPAALPLSKLYNAKDLQDAASPTRSCRTPSACAPPGTFVWARRCEAGEKIDLACLHIGPAYVLHMPGELFIEYQLAAQKMRPESPGVMAAYGDYGPGYIGTADRLYPGRLRNRPGLAGRPRSGRSPDAGHPRIAEIIGG